MVNVGSILKKVCGDVPVKGLNVDSWIAVKKHLEADTTLAQRTKADYQEAAKTFLVSVEQDHGFSFPWLGNKKYKIPRGKGRKERYTLEEMRKALSLATGRNRQILLFGLNFGFVTGDIANCHRTMLAAGGVALCQELRGDFVRIRLNSILSSLL